MKEKKQVCWERFPFVGAVFLVSKGRRVGGLGRILGLGHPQVLEAGGVGQITEEGVQGDKRVWVPLLPIPGDSDIYTQAQEE